MLECKKNGDMVRYNELNNILTKNSTRAGLFVPSVVGKIVDGDNFDKELGCNKQGELLVKGPTVTISYFNVSDDDIKGKFNNKDGFLITGDIGSINDKEQLIIHDRSKDMIKTGGEWISSIDMENHVSCIDFVERAAVIGVQHPKWIERPIVIVQIKEGYGDKNKLEMMRKRIYSKLEEKYAKFQMPNDILFWDEIPLTGPGKMSKKECRERLKNENYMLPEFRKDNNKNSIYKQSKL